MADCDSCVAIALDRCCRNGYSKNEFRCHRYPNFYQAYAVCQWRGLLHALQHGQDVGSTLECKRASVVLTCMPSRNPTPIPPACVKRDCFQTNKQLVMFGVSVSFLSLSKAALPAVAALRDKLLQELQRKIMIRAVNNTAPYAACVGQLPP
jgi:hypothetical protein